MPVKLGERETMGCEGEKPWPLVNVETGEKEACAGPDRDTAVRAVQARNMAHAGLLKRTWAGIYRAIMGGPEPGPKPKPPWVRLGAAKKEPPWVELSKSVRIVKQDEEKHVALGVVMEPADPGEIANWLRDGKKEPAPRGVDAQGDWAFADEIEKAAYGFMGRYRQGTGIKLGHEGQFIPAEIVESYLAPLDFELNGQRVVKASWLQAMRFPDPELWAIVKERMGGFSIGGRGKVTEE